jgi:hypothetical protein
MASTCWRSSAPKPTVQDHLCNISRLQATSPDARAGTHKISTKKCLKSICVGLRYSPRVNEDLYARPSRRPLFQPETHERRSPVLIDQINDTRTVQLTLPELQLSLRALMPETAVVTHHSTSSQHMRTRAHLRHRTINRTDWRGMGEVCVQSIEAAAVAQGGRNAGPGAYDVTDSKFSTSMGPPSCSPPV